jgi:NAD(P)H-quinone oxidoreductase subunit 5
MPLANAVHPLVIPLIPLLAGSLARIAPHHAHRIVTPALAGACVLAVFTRPAADALTRLDTLASTMAVLVSFVGAVVLRFSTRYLEGDPDRARFLSWMCLTLSAVLTLVISNHLLLLLGAWTATSLCLHRLLLHHPHRAGAVYAARKKFVFSRIAEGSLLAAALMLHAGHDTWRIDELTASIAAGNHAGLPAAAFLLAFCAMLKSAQFPFHSWLPDTMDTPTPVSALMHAGIVNAGGFLILRLAPVFAAAPAAMHLLAITGTFTAVFGAIVMLAQPAVKRSLAFSTIAQMGFMMIQCGLGAWGLALLHLVAHSLYKAHAFLRAGSTVGATPRAAIPLATPALAVGLISAAVIVAGLSIALKPLAPDTATPQVFLAIIAFALAYGIGRAWSGHARSLPLAMAIATAVGALACALHLTAAGFLTAPAPPPAPVWLTAIVGIAFALLFLFQALLWRASAHPLGRRLYVHALNGFYVGPLANRLLKRLWPTQPLA